MVLLRCTRRLASDARRHLPIAAARDRSTTTLGDWYANRLNHAQQRYVIATNATTLLALVVPARDLSLLPHRLSDALGLLLAEIGIREPLRARELDRMRDLRVAPVASRSVTASASDIARRAWEELYDLPHRPGRTLHHVNLILARTPRPALGFRTPADAALALLS